MSTLHLPTTPLPLTLAERRRRMIRSLASQTDAPPDRLRVIVAETAERESVAATHSAALRPIYRRLFLRDAHCAVGLSPHPDVAPLATH